jgi:hypothetical protein
LKNRHIGLQLQVANRVVQKQSTLGWYCIDILSDSDNDEPTKITNAMFKLKFAKLNGDGVSKWIIIKRDGSISNFGEI